MLQCFSSLASNVISGHKKEKCLFLLPGIKEIQECVTHKQFFILNTLNKDMENVQFTAQTFQYYYYGQISVAHQISVTSILISI